MGLGSTNVLHRHLKKASEFLQGGIPKKVKMAVKEKDENVFKNDVEQKCNEEM